jgi:hypothetical protein
VPGWTRARYQWQWVGMYMNDHQHAGIEQARIAWHEHQFQHDCYGRDCAEDRRLYWAYKRAINSRFAGPGPHRGRHPRRRVPDT